MEPILDAPIILLCSERSGSNLISKMFDAHPNICAPSASHLFKVMSECACKYPVESTELRDAVLALFDAKASSWKIDALSTAERRRLVSGRKGAGEIVASLYAQEARSHKKPHVMIEENSVFRYLNFITGQSKDPKYLFMVRDPRDMALSWVKGPVMRGGVLRATDRWVADQTGYLEILAQLPEGAQVSFLRYEDLIQNPEREMQRVCKDLALRFHAGMIDFHTHSDSAMSNAQLSKMWSNLDKPILSENSQKFIKGLSTEEIAYIEHIAGPIMDIFHYQSHADAAHPFGKFRTLAELRQFLAQSEPYDKPQYSELPLAERQRFERWSKLYASMSALPFSAPPQAGG